MKDGDREPFVEDIREELLPFFLLLEDPAVVLLPPYTVVIPLAL